MSQTQWKKFINEMIVDTAFKHLKKEKEKITKKKHIVFKKLEMSEYLVQNKNTLLSKIIFSTRSETLDFKVWNEWNYIDNTYVMCRFEEDNFDHFMTCILYGQNELKCSFIEIFGNDHEDQYDIAKEINRRLKIRKKKLDEVGLPTLAPLLQDTTVELH